MAVDELDRAMTLGWKQLASHTPWGDTFGMLTDRHGVSWLVNISGATS